MAEHLKKLNLALGAIDLGDSNRRQGLIVRDIQNIHDPTVSPITYLRQRREMVSDILELHASPHDNACGVFSATLTLVNHEKVRAWFDEPYRAPQAAGWAALHLLESLARGTSSVSEIHAIDPTEATAQKATDLTLQELDSISIEAFSELRESEGTDLTLLPISLGEFGMATQVSFRNQQALSLPDALTRIKERYDELYPEWDTSAAVAGIVGARSVEGFSEAWHAAEAQHDPQWPSTAPRHLLESNGVFLFNQV